MAQDGKKDKQKKQKNQTLKPRSDSNKADDIILWSIVGITGFCLFAGTLLHALPESVLVLTDEAITWVDKVLYAGFFAGLGFIGAAFRFYFAPGSTPEVLTSPPSRKAGTPKKKK